MIFQVDLHSAKPIYLQLIDQVKMALASGRLKPEDRLPSIRDVAVQLCVNRNTVARVYAELEREGLIYTRAGQGCFATDRGAAHLKDSVMREELISHLDQFLAQARVYHYTRIQLEKMFTERLNYFFNPSTGDQKNA